LTGELPGPLRSVVHLVGCFLLSVFNGFGRVRGLPFLRRELQGSFAHCWLSRVLVINIVLLLVSFQDTCEEIFCQLLIFSSNSLPFLGKFL
jgi:hypothetical protein